MKNIQISTCAAVIPPLSAIRTESLVMTATARLGRR